jgi:hypothetical protein
VGVVRAPARRMMAREGERNCNRHGGWCIEATTYGQFPFPPALPPLSFLPGFESGMPLNLVPVEDEGEDGDKDIGA